jgi:methylated-DNA-[protein]-cysteine S-methyltransferase
MKRIIDLKEVKYCSPFECALGAGYVVATGLGVYEIFPPFSRESENELRKRVAGHYPAAAQENGITKRCALLLARYFSGEEVDFDLPLDRRRITLFQSRVYDIVMAIPYGCVRSYKEIAEKIGCPNSARCVGRAMAANPYPIIVPCHRVLGSSGKLTGYSAPGGIESKKWLLAMEGASCI